MKQTKYNGTSLMKMLGSIVISFAMLFTFARSITAQQMDTMKGMRAEIPDGADRMVITQETIYPGEAYINALNYFERKGFMVMTSEDTTDESALNELVDSEPLAFEVKKQVSDSMALKYTINVQDRTQGSSLIAAVKWNGDVHADMSDWERAKWTEGKDKHAFFEALEILRGTAYDALTFEIGVAVTS